MDNVLRAADKVDRGVGGQADPFGDAQPTDRADVCFQGDIARSVAGSLPIEVIEGLGSRQAKVLRPCAPEPLKPERTGETGGEGKLLGGGIYGLVFEKHGGEFGKKGVVGPIGC